MSSWPRSPSSALASSRAFLFVRALIALALLMVNYSETQVSILGFNSPEWFIADLGAILAGGLAAGICE